MHFSTFVGRIFTFFSWHHIGTNQPKSGSTDFKNPDIKITYHRHYKINLKNSMQKKKKIQQFFSPSKSSFEDFLFIVRGKFISESKMLLYLGEIILSLLQFVLTRTKK